MLSIRSFARVAPRIASRASAQLPRSSVIAAGIRSSAWRQSSITSTSKVAAFSTSLRRPQVLEELVAKLDSELKLEADARNPPRYSESIEEYLKESGYQLHDTPGQEDVQLSKRFGDESITVSFSIADLSASDFGQEGLEEDDNAFLDEEPEINAQSGGANTKGSVAQGRTPGGNMRIAPEDRVSPADRPELEEDYDEMDDNQQPAFPARLNVKVQKEGQKGAMMIEAVAQDGEIIIDNVYFFPDGKLADPQSADTDFGRKSVYAGPPFGNLDEDLQILLERYLSERGIDTQMALFVPDYIDFKEQKEYLRWLENVKGFLS